MVFYCLQNITLVENEDGNYNVVDGQQRLTTLALLLSHLNESELVEVILSIIRWQRSKNSRKSLVRGSL